MEFCDSCSTVCDHACRAASVREQTVVIAFRFGVRAKISATLEVIGCCAPLAASTLSEEEAVATAELFKALGDPARVRIVNLLATATGRCAGAI